MAGIIRGLHDKNDCESSRCTLLQETTRVTSFAQPSVYKQDPGLVADTKQKWLQWFLLRFLSLIFCQLGYEGSWPFSFYLCNTALEL